MSAAEEQDDAPDVLEETGALEADVGAKFDYQLSNIDPRLKIDMDPLAHRDFRPEMMFIRDELRQAKFQALAVRRMALKKLLLQDFIREDCELRNLGLAYAPADA
ncbi:uncharacterized protein LOC125233783 [Leguminivora glycinivorella]|uniref:uncharacterized protein LOC125233783 n=1 Tax=Leguminivora glycinivorella TaxID=1035111 RepID=UPI00200E3476|nr:uncharacterized protein LOC125233783 [Leguminivora glycinivorella]